MSLDYYFDDQEGQDSSKIKVSQPLPHCFLIRNGFTLDEIIDYYKLLTKLPWIIQEIEVAGKRYLPKRETLGFSDQQSNKLLKNNTFYAISYPNFFNELKEKIQFIIKNNVKEIEKPPQMNFIWGNRYRTGEDKVGKHKDKTKGHSTIDPIISISFGTYRHFDIFDDYKRIYRTDLGHGDIFLMMPDFQEAYFHSVPIQKKIIDARINLTFRTINDSSKIDF